MSKLKQLRDFLDYHSDVVGLIFFVLLSISIVTCFVVYGGGSYGEVAVTLMTGEVIQGEMTARHRDYIVILYGGVCNHTNHPHKQENAILYGKVRMEIPLAAIKYVERR